MPAPANQSQAGDIRHKRAYDARRALDSQRGLKGDYCHHSQLTWLIQYAGLLLALTLALYWA